MILKLDLSHWCLRSAHFKGNKVYSDYSLCTTTRATNRKCCHDDAVSFVAEFPNIDAGGIIFIQLFLNHWPRFLLANSVHTKPVLSPSYANTACIFSTKASGEAVL